MNFGAGVIKSFADQVSNADFTVWYWESGQQ